MIEIEKEIAENELCKRKQVFYGIVTGSQIHACSDSDTVFLVPALRDTSSSKFSRGFPNMKEINFKGPISQGKLVQKVLKMVAKHCEAMAVIVGTNPENTLGGWLRFARYFANQLPTTTILAVYKENIIFQRGLKPDPRPNFYSNENHISLRDTAASASEKTKCLAVTTTEFVSRNGSVMGLEDVSFNGYKEEALKREFPEWTLGWPLVRQEAPRNSRARNMSVVQWAMSLPNRSAPVTLQNQIGSNPNKNGGSFNIEIYKLTVKELEAEGTSPQVIQTHGDESLDGSTYVKDDSFGLVCRDNEKVSSSLVSCSVNELPKSKLGWPLLRTADSVNLDSLRDSEGEKMSMVQWTRGQPNQSTAATPLIQTCSLSNMMENFVKQEITHSNVNSARPSKTLRKQLEHSLKINTPDCKWFSYAELRSATSDFSTETFIGEGGCSIVHKGCLPNGKLVAVKVLKSYKEAWNDFLLEINIISSLKHKHITPLIGVCIEDSHLIAVYDFLPKGSLDESLHGQGEKSVLPWEQRFKVAVVIAEALNYLHNECPRPVIHRDIKSSNILLSNDLQPQVSDFGLAVWGPTDSSYLIQSDVLGTFGYIAPEYFMHGKINNKIDIYSFGVVLLELLSGRRPIGFKAVKGQESLVKWAKPLLESGNLKELLDPKLDWDFNVIQMQRMVLTAALCINQSPQLRPKVSQILELLRGEKDANEWVTSFVTELKKTENQEDDAPFLEQGCMPQMGYALLDAAKYTTLETDTKSQKSAKQNRRFRLKDYLQEQLHRAPSYSAN